MSNNGADNLDDDERMQRAQLIAEMREQARRRIAQSEELVENLRASAPQPDARPWGETRATPEPKPEPEREQAGAGAAYALAALRSEIEMKFEVNRQFNTELLELVAGDLRKMSVDEIEETTKTFSSEMREVRNAIAAVDGRMSGQMEVLRDEIARGKTLIEELRAEVGRLRDDLTKAQESLGQVWSRFGRLEAVR